MYTILFFLIHIGYDEMNKAKEGERMFIPKYFLIKDTEIIYDIIEDYSFATLFSQYDGKPWASHLPLILDQTRTYLYGHFARANPQWKEIEEQTVLAVFHGPHGYISPSWYETNRAVPTWNYIAVHVTGKLEIIEGEALANSLDDMVLKYEKPNSTYRLQEVDSEYIEGLNRGIVGFRIKIEQLEGKAKLSQNHSEQRQQLVIEELEKSEREDDRKIGLLMKENLGK